MVTIIIEIKYDKFLRCVFRPQDSQGNPWFYDQTNKSSMIMKYTLANDTFNSYSVEGKTVTDNPVINLAGGQLIYDEKESFGASSATISASFRASFSALSFLLSDFLLKFFEDINTRGTSNRIRTYVWVFPLEYSAKLSI